jgi:probable F420-dependent oxidoreductase
VPPLVQFLMAGATAAAIGGAIALGRGSSEGARDGVKVRIGFGLGTQSMRSPTAAFAPFVDALEGHGFDSVWFSERLTGSALDPVVAAAVAAGRTSRLKLGFSVLILPGRNPALLASELASLDVLSNGRLLPAVGLGAANAAEQQAFGVARQERAAWVDEVLPLLRRLWSEDSVDHDGPRFSFQGLRVGPKPAQETFDVWLGGRAPAELRRVGRLGDGWLPSFTTPEQAAAGRVVVEAAAADAGRAIDPEHWGVLVPYAHGPLPDAAVDRIRRRAPDVEPADVIPIGLDGLRTSVQRFVEVGFSKFVVVPVIEPADWEDEIAGVADALLSLQA